MKRVLFWTMFIPLLLTMLLIGVVSYPMMVFRGCVYVYMELMDRFERWCFNDPHDIRYRPTLRDAFREGYDT